MKVAIVTRQVYPEGGVSLASFRLASALEASGHEAEVLYTCGEPPAGELAALGRRIEAAEDGAAPSRLDRVLERRQPDLVLVGSGRHADIRAAAAVAPTAFHSHMHNGVCADNSRFWARLQRPCGVRAGWHCTLLRPVLGCASLSRAVNPAHVATQRKFREELARTAVGVVCVSSYQAELFAAHGVPRERITVLPNLGIRATPAELHAAAARTPAEWRGASAFIGRLSKAKGGELLPDLAAALPREARFRVFGDGYLAARLAALPGGALCGHVDQDAVTGVLMWARAVVFPSLWPEPGGIVGIDAQVMGVPLGAFEVGAARDWPAARRFRRGDVAAMAAWLGEREARREARDPDAVAAAQQGYWGRIAERGAAALGSFAASGRFAATTTPAEELILSQSA